MAVYLRSRISTYLTLQGGLRVAAGFPVARLLTPPAGESWLGDRVT